MLSPNCKLEQIFRSHKISLDSTHNIVKWSVFMQINVLVSFFDIYTFFLNLFFALKALLPLVK